MLSWAFNEEESIAEFIGKAEQFLRELTDDFELIIIDDGSADGTRRIVESQLPHQPWLRLYVNDRNRGSGFNMRTAIGLAQKDYLFCQTVDWSYDISALLQCWPLLHQYDVLQGFRPHATSLDGILGHRSDTRWKGVVSVVNYGLLRLLFPLPVRDFQNVTVYPRALAQQLQLAGNSAFTNPEGLLKASWAGASIKEFPVPFRKRRHGQAKGTRLPVILRSMRDMLRCWWSNRNAHRPQAQLTPWLGVEEGAAVLPASRRRAA